MRKITTAKGCRNISLRAQSTLEFTFACVALSLLIYGMVQCYRWVMMDLVQRRYEHEATLFNGEVVDPGSQVTPRFYTPRKTDTFYYKPAN